MVTTNDERSAAEVAEFKRNPPERYFLYIDRHTGDATTWTGELLGRTTFGHSWTVWGSRRVSISIRGVNAHLYRGTYFEGAGDYARIRHVKACQCHQKRAEVPPM